MTRRLLFGWTGACIALLALLLGSRAAYYAGAVPAFAGPLVERVFGLQVQLVSRQLFWARREALVLGVLSIALIVLALGRLWLLEPSPSGRRLRPWLYALVATGALYHSYLYDADPFMAAVCFGSLAMICLTVVLRSVLPQRAPTAAAALLALALGLLAWGAPARACAVGVASWAAFLLAAGWLVRRRLALRDALLCTAVALPLFTFVLPVLGAPLWRGPLAEKARLMEPAYAYAFCELPEEHRLFVTVPVCETRAENCLEGYVAEYDTRDYDRRLEHRFFDAGFSGRLREVLCFDEVIQVSMVEAMLDGEPYSGNVFEFRADDPSSFRRTILGPEPFELKGLDIPAHRAAHDRRRGAAFYVSEWTNKVFRYDVAAGTLDRNAGAALPPKQMGRWNFGIVTGPGAISEERDALYLHEWVNGSRIFEMDLETLRIRRTLWMGDAGGIGHTVDDERDRLIAAGLWGINVFDLGSGELLLRHRTGVGMRTPTIDARHGLVYVTSTFGGYVWVLDRDSLDVLGRLPTGIGGRRSYVTSDGRALFVSDRSHTYLYDTDTLAAHFRDGG